MTRAIGRQQLAAGHRLDARGGLQRQLLRAVELVDVVAELHDAILGSPGGDVLEIDGHFLGQLDRLVLAAADRRLDLLTRPAGRFLEQPCREIAHILDAHAAGALEAGQLVEQALLRCVVHVLVVRIVEVDLGRGHCVDLAGVLPEGQVRRLVGVPVDRLGRDLIAAAVDKTDGVALEIFRILTHRGAVQ